MAHTDKATLGCLSSIGNRLFCSCKLPSNQEVEGVEPDHHAMELETEKKVKVLMSPGIVARLMGLESMPENNWETKDRTLNLVGRSRSVNSIDYWSDFHPVKGFHRRIKTSIAFRESDDFLFVRSESIPQRNMTAGSKEKERSKAEISSREVKVREVEIKKRNAFQKKELQKKLERPVYYRRVNNESKNKKKSLTAPTKHSCSASTVHRTPLRGKVPPELPYQKVHHKGKSIKEIKKVQPESSRNRRREHLPVKEIPKRRNSNSRRKQPQKIVGSRSTSANSNCCSQSVNKEEDSNKQCGSAKLSGYVEVRQDVDELEIENFEGLIWKHGEMWKLVHEEEIGVELELGILDQLVHEIVAQLSGFPVESLGYLMMDDYR